MSKFSDEEQAELTQIQEYHANKQKIKLLEQQLASAHREGWEQCQRQVNNLFNEAACGMLTMEQLDKAIATMEYGGKAND